MATPALNSRSPILINKSLCIAYYVLRKDVQEHTKKSTFFSEKVLTIIK